MEYKLLTMNYDKNLFNSVNGCDSQRIKFNMNSGKQWLREKHIHDRSQYQTYITNGALEITLNLILIKNSLK